MSMPLLNILVEAVSVMLCIVSMLMCVGTCVCVCVRAHACVYVLRIVSMEKILRCYYYEDAALTPVPNGNANICLHAR